jgi:hypothetical protein
VTASAPSSFKFPEASLLRLLVCSVDLCLSSLAAMSAEDGFKIPSLLPQDLLLIHDIVGTQPPPLAQVKDEDDICSSGSSSGDKNESLSDAGSEDEVEGLVFASDDDSETKK